MMILSMIQAALMALSANKTRTVLTMLGIVIGVAAVIALMAAGQGAKQGVTKEVSGLGSNLIFISAQQNQSQEGNRRSFNPFSLTTDDADALKGPDKPALRRRRDRAVQLGSGIADHGQRTFDDRNRDDRHSACVRVRPELGSGDRKVHYRR